MPGILTAADVAATAESIASVQLASGMIPWFPWGHADPWNHVEAAMALDVARRHPEAKAAYAWLARRQRPDGAWHQYYIADHGDEEAGIERVEADQLDANVCAYVATGVWHHFLVTGDVDFLESMWPVVDAAVGFVLGLQTRRGEILWARHPDGTPWSFALLTGSASICHSLGCALAIAGRLGHRRPRWDRGRTKLAAIVAGVPEAFAPKDRWAMDWYYPVLAGVVGGGTGRRRLAEGWDRFVIDGEGVRCVHDRPWVTAAETAECALAHLAVGEQQRALDLFAWAQALRAGDGSYYTGIVLPERVHYPAGVGRQSPAGVGRQSPGGVGRQSPAGVGRQSPGGVGRQSPAGVGRQSPGGVGRQSPGGDREQTPGGERATYSAAAVLLAADALSAMTPASGLFSNPPFFRLSPAPAAPQSRKNGGGTTTGGAARAASQ